MTRKTRLLAHIYIVLCGGCLVIGTLVCLGILFSGEENSRETLTIAAGIVGFLSIIYLIPGLIGGIGLLHGRRWARVVIIILSLFVIIAFPFGTALAAFGLWVLLGPESKRPPDAPTTSSPRPLRLPTRSPEEKTRMTGVLVAMATVGSIMIIVLGTGFRITNDPRSFIGDGLYYGAIVVLALVVGGVVRSGWVGDVMSSLRGGRLGPIDRMQIRADQERRQQEWRKRLDALAADPVKRKYVERIERGESWSDAQIEYDLDPSRVATCAHLQPIERAMRDAGVEVLLEAPVGDGARVSARCRVDANAIRDRFSLPPFVEYATPTPVGRAFEEALPAMIRCGQCASQISVVHRLDAKHDTPIFPPDGIDTPIETEETSDRFVDLHRRIQELGRVIDVPKYYLPTFRVPEGNGSPHIEIDGDTYHYVTSERGVERERHPTRSLDDLLYWIFRDVTFSMAVRTAAAHQKPGEDFRRAMYRDQLALLRRLNADWEARGHLEHLETLARFPFVDVKR